MADQNQVIGDFMAMIKDLSPSQLTLVQNQLIMETYRRLMTK